VPSIGRDADVVREERGPEAADEPRSPRLGDVDDRELLRLRAERDPQRAAGRIDRDVARERSYSCPTEHPTALHVECDDLPPRGVGHVRVPTVRMAGGVARLAETVQNVGNRERPRVDQAHRPDLGVGDECHAADRLDAARERQRPDVPPDTPARELHGNETRFEVGGDQPDRGLSRGRRERARSECQRGGGEDELTAVHAFGTVTAPNEVQRLVTCSRVVAADSPADIPYPIPKRIVDKAIAATLLVLLSPVLLVVVVAMAANMLVCWRDRGSVFYREPRVSRGRTFDLLKFRTLRTDALAEMHASRGHARLWEAEPSNLTWTGRRVLKPWYLDELPQLVCVLRGDISLVGPRPWPSSMVERQVAEGFDYRNRILAGLTGPAQVTKGAAGSRYVDLDLAYLELCQTLSSRALVRYDLRILRQTVGVIARGEGLNY